MGLLNDVVGIFFFNFFDRIKQWRFILIVVFSFGLRLFFLSSGGGVHGRTHAHPSPIASPITERRFQLHTRVRLPDSLIGCHFSDVFFLFSVTVVQDLRHFINHRLEHGSVATVLAHGPLHVLHLATQRSHFDLGGGGWFVSVCARCTGCGFALNISCLAVGDGRGGGSSFITARQKLK